MMNALIVVCALSGMRLDLRSAMPIARQRNSIAILSISTPNARTPPNLRTVYPPAARNAVTVITQWGRLQWGISRNQVRSPPRWNRANPTPPQLRRNDHFLSEAEERRPREVDDRCRRRPVIADRIRERRGWGKPAVRAERRRQAPCRVADDRRRNSEKSLRRHPTADCGTLAAASHVNSVTSSTVMRSLQLTREVRLDERKIRCLDFESAYQPATRMEDALSRLRLVGKAGAAQCDIEIRHPSGERRVQ